MGGYDRKKEMKNKTDRPKKKGMGGNEREARREKNKKSGKKRALSIGLFTFLATPLKRVDLSLKYR